MNKRKISFLSLIGLLIVAGCGSEKPKCVHEYSNDHDTTCNLCGLTREPIHTFTGEYVGNSYGHYQMCECGEKGPLYVHVFDDDHDTTCNICGYERTITHYFSNLYKFDDTNHWHECACGEKDAVIPHVFDHIHDPTCNVCGYTRDVEHDYTGEYEEDGTYHWKTCICGEKLLKAEHVYDNAVDDTCNVCGHVREIIPPEDLEKLKPVSLTMSLYDTTKNDVVTYGFNWNTLLKSTKQVVQYFEGTLEKDDLFPTEFNEVNATVEKASTYKTDDSQYDYYIYKALANFEINKTYTYRVYDKDYNVAGKISSFTAVNPITTSFKFAHISDTQAAESTGFTKEDYSRKSFQSILKDDNEFTIHTGDVVEYSKYEDYWTRMLDGNFDSLSKLPIMAISGNHETTYHNGSNETYKHFNLNLPVQTSTYQGIYYSYTYGNAKFIMLNTNKLVGNKLETEQYNWLLNELQNNTKQWLFVSLHNPLYSVGTYGANPDRNAPAVGLKNQLTKLFADNHVDVVLQGHDHMTSRTLPLTDVDTKSTESYTTIEGIQYINKPNGTIYAMDGTGGEQIKSIYAINDLYAYAEQSKKSTWAEYSINNKMLKVEVKCFENNQITTLKTWGIAK